MTEALPARFKCCVNQTTFPASSDI